MEFVLPLKVHFRYCWLFSGVPLHTVTHLGNGSNPLTDHEMLRVNRTLMTGENSELCGQVSCDNVAYKQDVKAFWLTTDGRLVYVDRLSEDIKFRRLRQRNLQVALSLWDTNPELCSRVMRDSGLAHGNLAKMCGEAACLSKGRFYNLYANYPLPRNTEGGEQDLSLDLGSRVNENDIALTEIRNGGELILELQPLYMAYFSFISDNSTSDVLRERVSLLGAQWLVQEDISELDFTLNLRNNWFTRMCIRIALFLARL